MGYSYEGYYVDPVALREFAAKTAPETPPGEALNRLYSFCENNGSLLELEDAFKDTHPSWFLALDHTMQKLGIPECLSLSNLICAQVRPFPIHITRKFALVICREKMLRLWRINLSMWNPCHMRKRILMKSSMGWFSFGNAVETLLLRKRILFSFHWIIWMRKRMFLPLIFRPRPLHPVRILGKSSFLPRFWLCPGSVIISARCSLARSCSERFPQRNLRKNGGISFLCKSGFF